MTVDTTAATKPDVNDDEKRLAIPVSAQVGYNPYRYMVDDDQLLRILLRAGEARRDSIWLNYATTDEARLPRGPYKTTSFGITLLNPIIWPWTEPEHYVLGKIWVGGDGERLTVNATCKAFNAWRLDGNYGDAVNVHPLLCGTGNFRWGHNGKGLVFPFGGSGQDANQDQYEAACAESDVATELLRRHRAWELATGKTSWFGEPDPQWARFATLTGPRRQLADVPYGT